MSKIVAAVNVMISNPTKITNVVKGAHDTESFFKYDKKHNWSIWRTSDEEYFMSYYAADADLEGLANIPDEHWTEVSPEQVTYNSRDLGTKEAKATFRELFTIISEKALGMDDILEDIIDSDSPF